MTKKEMVIDAITRHLVLSIRYDGYQRVIEPHAFGGSDKGEPLLRCWQVSSSKPGSRPGWRLMNVAEMFWLGPTGDTFSNARPGYKRGDTAMVRIYAQL